MPTPSDTCLKCQGKMCDGFIVDNGDGHLKLAAAWHPGEIITSIWCGIKVQQGKLRPITANRCDSCGFVEMYAM